MRAAARAYAGGGRLGPGLSRKPVLLKGLAIGLGVMAIQIGLLLDSFDLYVQGKGGRIWQLATTGGLVLFGSVMILWMLHSPPNRAR